MSASSDRRRVARALASLDERARQLLALSRLEGLAAREIAALVRMTPASVARELVAAERVLRRDAGDRSLQRRRA